MTAERDADPLAATLQSDDAALAHTVEGPRAPGTLQSSALTTEHPGRYTRAEELGRGGMGRVVLAVDRHLGREVAMKELLAHAGAADSAMSVGAAVRFLREARITGQLEHPSIVPVHELGQREDGTIYYTMKRIRGRSLAHALREGEALGDRLTLIGHFRAACDAVAYAHSRGVVHRDLKPDNVMVGEFGETLVVDWGLAKVRGEAEPGEIDRRVRVALGEDAGTTIDGHALGTPAYMSPEQARGEIESIDERSDVWGLGAMLYEILTGRPPYVAESVLAVVNKVLEERPPRVREICPEAPAELAAIAERALSRDPGSRYPGAKELAAEIAAWQDGRTVRAYEYTALELVRRFFARNRGAAYATLGVLAALVTAALLTFDGYTREQRARAIAEQRGQTEAAQRERAEASALAASAELAEALVSRAELARDRGDPALAAVLAARALARDPAYGRAVPAPPREDAERAARAMACLIGAYESQRYVHARELPGVRFEAEPTPDGRALVFSAAERLVRVDVAGGDRREQSVPGVGAVLAVLDDERVIALGEPPGVFSLATGERLLELDRAVTDADVRGDTAVVATSSGDVVFHDRESMVERARVSSSIRGRAAVAAMGPSSAVIGSTSQLFVERVSIDGAPARVELSGTLLELAASPHDGAVAAVQSGFGILLFAGGEPWSVAVPASATSAAWIAPWRYAAAESDDRVVLRERVRALETLHPARGQGHRVVVAGARLVAIARPAPGGLPSASVFRPAGGYGPDEQALESAIADATRDGARDRVVVAAGDEIWTVGIVRDRLSTPASFARLPEGARRVIALGSGAIAFALRDGRAGIVEQGGEPRVLFTPSSALPYEAGGVAFDEERSVLLAADAGGVVARVRLDGERLDPLTGHDELVVDVAVSSRGEVATASVDGTVRLFDARGTGRVIEQHEATSSAVAFSPDGARLATGDGHGVVRVRDAGTGEQRGSFAIARARVERITWSDDGRSLVIAGGGRVRVIDADTGALRRMETAPSPRGAWLAPGGARLVYADGRRLVRTALELPLARDAASLVRWAEGRAGPGLTE